jgi:hypothetical protein
MKKKAEHTWQGYTNFSLLEAKDMNKIGACV